MSERVPVLPCWYCEGLDPEGQPYDAQVHTGWYCDACRERRALLADRDRWREMCRELVEAWDTAEWMDAMQKARAMLEEKP